MLGTLRANRRGRNCGHDFREFVFQRWPVLTISTPCLSAALHIGHCSWYHTTLASGSWMIGRKTSAMGAGMRAVANVGSLGGNDWLALIHFFSLQVWIWNLQSSQHSRIWRKPKHTPRNDREQIPWGNRKQWPGEPESRGEPVEQGKHNWGGDGT